MERYLSDGSQVFNVPNNEEGWAFIKQCHKFLHTRRQKLVKRGRGKRDGTWNGRVSISPKKSEWIAVYTQYKKTESEVVKDRELSIERNKEDIALVKRVQELEAKLFMIKNDVRNAVHAVLV